jgi:polyisoprenoid-binding protein YceI
VAILCAILAASAQAATYKIDPTHSKVKFSIKHMGIGIVSGVFDEFEGSFEYNEEDLAKSSVQASIQTASVDTDASARDKHLRSADFFDVENHPTMTFKSKSVKNVMNGNFTLVGDLTMLGVTKEVELKVEKVGEGTDQRGNKKVGYVATGTTNRMDYGMKYDKNLPDGTPSVGHEVSITIEIEAAEQQDAQEPKSQ